ncbi:MAG: 2-phospho-L-lactate transferase [Alphaproteobacteria bacterium]|nr:2-phospho-L-lactate transferase [Alphaproteobacteria bacterium]
MSVLALAGGVGGARLAAGLARALPPGDLAVAVNTGDDFEHLGLSISPDIDTVVYTLAGLNNPELGWGLASETWAFMAALERLGGETWFRLGDRDLATHVERTRRLAAGETLSAITADFAARLDIAQRIVPMSDDPVRTIVETDEGALAFQDYFVRRQCAPVFRGLRFDGADGARPSAGFAEALADPALEAIVICPSNPLLSLGPILAVPEVRAALAARRVPCIAVSPFIGGQAVKGPAGKIMAELGRDATPAGLLALYDGLVDGLVIDGADAGARADVPLHVTDTLMRGPDDQTRLAREALAFAAGLAR